MTATKILRKARLGSTHWGKLIIAAEKRGSFDETDRRLSKNWVTCACGKLKFAKRNWDGVPVDYFLKKFGMEFTKEIIRNSFLGAAKKLISIEKRAVKLVKKGVI